MDHCACAYSLGASYLSVLFEQVYLGPQVCSVELVDAVGRGGNCVLSELVVRHRVEGWTVQLYVGPIALTIGWSHHQSHDR